jgi:hypothetical protein
MDISDAIKGEDTHRLLHSPVFLLKELAGSLIPRNLVHCASLSEEEPTHSHGAGYRWVRIQD